MLYKKKVKFAEIFLKGNIVFFRLKTYEIKQINHIFNIFFAVVSAKGKGVFAGNRKQCR